VAADDEEAEARTQLINVHSIGRVFASPQNSRRSIIELNYHSINDAPVFLEVEWSYETVRQSVMDAFK
jgi:hypothetical protein